jgi:hypothetical protein
MLDAGCWMLGAGQDAERLGGWQRFSVQGEQLLVNSRSGTTCCLSSDFQQSSAVF